MTAQREALQLDAPPRLKLGPVVWWAALGAVFVVTGVAVLGAWLVSGDPQRTPTGPDPVPSWMTIAARMLEVLSICLAIGFIYWFVVRPRRRSGHISADGLLCLAFFSAFWMDPVLNLFQPWATWNAAFVNFGGWLGHIPGSLSPTADKYALPVLFLVPAYTFFFMGPCLLGGAVIAGARRRYGMRLPAAVATCFVTLLAFDMLFEIPVLRLGLFSYPGAPRWSTIFDGHYYQYPIHVGVTSAAWWTLIACLRYFRNDRGETIAERGIGNLQLEGWRKAFVRYLALAGIASLTAMTYHLPAAVIGLHAGPWPKDVQQRSYLTNAMCGPGTEIECPGPGVPIARKGAASVQR